ncbi:MAG: glycosyltransferase family 39 protein [Candidatus Omnitrophica bacterium]|nr:glycosyltransferase family 39 protein [Candidatus Omnitrophota bacterium]
MKGAFGWISLGTGAGVLWTFSPGTGFLLLLVLGFSLLFERILGPRDLRFVRVLFLAGFFFRAALSLGLDGLSCLTEKEFPERRGPPDENVLNVTDHTRRFMQLGDSDYYSMRAYALAQRGLGNLPVVPHYYHGQYGRSGHVHLMAAFYALFGFSPVAVKLINCLLGALLGPVLFLLFREIFNGTIARWASGLCAFFPSLVLWSVTNLKEPLLILLTALLLLLFTRARKADRWKVKLSHGVGFALLLNPHASVRSEVYTAVLVLSLGAAAFWTSRIRLRWKGLLLLALFIAGLQARSAFRPFLAQALTRHVGYVNTSRGVYKYLPDGFYSEEALRRWAQTGEAPAGRGLLLGVAKAVGHYWVEPLPGPQDSPRMRLTLPQMVLWYLLLPPALVGMGAALGRAAWGGLALFLMLSGWGTLGALTAGNAWAVFRFRDMVTPYVLLFSCAGIWILLKGPDEILPSDVDS